MSSDKPIAGAGQAELSTEIEQASPLRDLAAWGVIGLLGISSFLFGAYGTEAVMRSPPRAAIAETVDIVETVQAKPTAAVKPDVKATDQGEKRAEVQPAEPEADKPLSWDDVDSSGFAESSSEGSEEVIPVEKNTAGQRPPKPTNPPGDNQASGSVDAFDTGDDPWAALGGDTAAPAAAESETAPTDAGNNDAGETN